jgi:hypothetical protein
MKGKSDLRDTKFADGQSIVVKLDGRLTTIIFRHAMDGIVIGCCTECTISDTLLPSFIDKLYHIISYSPCWIAKTLLLLFIVISDKDEELACPQMIVFFNVVISLVVLKLECCIMI